MNRCKFALFFVVLSSLTIIICYQDFSDLIQIAQFMGLIVFLIVVALVVHGMGYIWDHYHWSAKDCDGCHSGCHHWLTTCSYRPYISFDEHLAGKTYVSCAKKYCNQCANRYTKKYSNTDMFDNHYYWDECKNHRSE